MPHKKCHQFPVMTTQSKRSRRSIVVENDSMDIEEETVLSEGHQLLLTFIIHSKMVTEKDLKKIHEKIFNDTEELNQSLLILTNELDAIKKDIKQAKCDISGEKYYMFIDTSGESYFPYCSIFTNPQLEFLKQVLTGIVLSRDGGLMKMAALNGCRGITKSHADETLSLFVKEKILIENEQGCLFLSPLAALEFKPFYEACFPDNLTTCDLCKQIVFVGMPCDGCSEKFHRHCIFKWLKSRNTGCPKCSYLWE